MKLRLLIPFLFSCATVWAQSTVTLSGHIKHVNNQITIENFSEFQYLDLPDTKPVFIPDSTGAFTITFPLKAPNYFRLSRNVLYLTPGDHLQMEIDIKDQSKSTFSGDGSIANNYLVATPFPKAGSYINAGSNIYPAPEATLDTLLASAARRRRQLDALTGVSAEFKRLEAARIKADVINSINAVPSYLFVILGHHYNDEYLRLFNKLARPVKEAYSRNFIDASLMKLLPYRDIADELMKNAPLTDDAKLIRDWFAVSDLIHEMTAVKEKAGLLPMRNKLNGIVNPAFRQAGSNYLDYLQRFGKGDKAVDFTCMDISGKPVHLSSLKGKLIYVDFWATWCGPCLQEMPALEALKTQFKNDTDVVFVSVSIDDENNIAGWKKNLADRKAGGYQWQINRAKLNAYNLTEVPRALLIDKDFRMVDLHGPMPSDPRLATIIQKLKG